VNFEVHLSSKATKFLKNADKELYNRIINKLKKLSEDPFPQDAKRVVGQKEKVFRVRLGGYRILYVVYLDKNVVLVADVDKRERIYRQ